MTVKIDMLQKIGVLQKVVLYSAFEVKSLENQAQKKPSKKPQACNSTKKKTLVEVLLCEFCEISNNTFFIKHIWWLLLIFAEYQTLNSVLYQDYVTVECEFNNYILTPNNLTTSAVKRPGVWDRNIFPTSAFQTK